MNKFKITLIMLFIGAIAYAQEIAPEGSYSIECSEKQKRISLSEDTRILIEESRLSDRDNEIVVKKYTIRIMSEEKLSKGIRWSQHVIVSKEK